MDPELLKEQRVKEAELSAKKEMKRKQALAMDSDRRVLRGGYGGGAMTSSYLEEGAEDEMK